MHQVMSMGYSGILLTRPGYSGFSADMVSTASSILSHIMLFAQQHAYM